MIYDIANLKVEIKNEKGRTKKQAIPYLAKNSHEITETNLNLCGSSYAGAVHGPSLRGSGECHGHSLRAVRDHFHAGRLLPGDRHLQ